MRGSKQDGARLFSVLCGEMRRSNGLKLKYRKFPLNVSTLFPLSVTEHWNKVVWFPSLELIKTQLDMALSSLL